MWEPDLRLTSWNTLCTARISWGSLRMSSGCPSRQALRRGDNKGVTCSLHPQAPHSCSKDPREEIPVTLPLMAKDLHSHLDHKDRKRGCTREENIIYKERRERKKKKKRERGSQEGKKRDMCSHTNNHSFLGSFCWFFFPSLVLKNTRTESPKQTWREGPSSS